MVTKRELEQRISKLEEELEHQKFRYDFMIDKFLNWAKDVRKDIEVLYSYQVEKDFTINDDIPQKKELEQALKQAKEDLKELQREVLNDDE